MKWKNLSFDIQREAQKCFQLVNHDATAYLCRRRMWISTIITIIMIILTVFNNLSGSYLHNENDDEGDENDASRY